jgi:hypothetical protein
MTGIMQGIFIDPTVQQPPTRDLPRAVVLPDTLPTPKETKHHPTDGGNENASVFFVGNATVIMFVELTSFRNSSSTLIDTESGLEFGS